VARAPAPFQFTVEVLTKLPPLTVQRRGWTAGRRAGRAYAAQCRYEIVYGRSCRGAVVARERDRTRQRRHWPYCLRFPPGVAVTTRVTVAVPGLFMVPRLQVTVLVPLHVPLTRRHRDKAGAVRKRVGDRHFGRRIRTVYSSPLSCKSSYCLRSPDRASRSRRCPRSADCPDCPATLPHQVAPTPISVHSRPVPTGVAAYSCIVHISRSFAGSTTVRAIGRPQRFFLRSHLRSCSTGLHRLFSTVSDCKRVRSIARQAETSSWRLAYWFAEKRE